MRLQDARKDLYRRLAKEQGFKSRAAFKLIEANERYDFIREGSWVLDLGAAPGGWLQVCARLTDPSRVVGVDLNEVHLKERVHHIRMDVMSPRLVEAVRAVTGGQVDVVLSDLAPTVSGVWELDNTLQVDLTLRALEVCGALLKRGGSGFFKLFEGERSEEGRAALRERFETVRAVKPAASRSQSSELYYYCSGFRGPPTAG